MNHSVDLATSGQITLKKGTAAALWVKWKDEISPEQWYRVAPSFAKGHGEQMGWRAEIVGEGTFVDEDGVNKAFIKVKNASGDEVSDEGLIAFVLTVMCSANRR